MWIRYQKYILIESDPLWYEALKATFDGYNNVEIISAYIGDGLTGGTPLSKVIKEKSDLFIKMDIEGNELDALAGMKDVLGNVGNKYAVCTYHGYEDEQRIISIFEKNKILFEFSEGYMFVPSENRNEFPHLRHGVIRGVKFE